MLVEALFIQPNVKINDGVFGYACPFHINRNAAGELVWQRSNLPRSYGAAEIDSEKSKYLIIITLQCSNLGISERQLKLEHLDGGYFHLDCHCEQCDDEVYFSAHNKKRPKCYSLETSTGTSTNIIKSLGRLITASKLAILDFIGSGNG